LKSSIRRAQNWLNQGARKKMVLLLIGGAVGTWLRYVIGKWVDEQNWAEGFPFGTMIINVSGSFILGAAAVIIHERLAPEYQDWYLLIGTGFCGGYTTFSTFELETFKLVRDGSFLRAFYNVAGSVVAGFLALVLAVILVNALLPRRPG
jgi:CrcB protein